MISYMIVSRDTIKSSYLMTKAKNTPIEAPAPLSELERSVAVLISDINLLSRVLFNRAAKEWDLTSTQWQILSVIYRDEHLTQSEVADMLSRGKSSIGKSIDSLENRGWVVRVPDAKDRRVKRLQLTDKIVKLTGQLSEPLIEINNIIERGLDANERESLMQSLQKIHANLTKVANQ